MKVRYKNTTEERYVSSYNMSALNEINMYDDSAYPSDLEAYIEAKGEWKCMQEAFNDKDIIPDDYNTSFREPKNEEERTKGYY